MVRDLVRPLAVVVASGASRGACHIGQRVRLARAIAVFALLICYSGWTLNHLNETEGILPRPAAHGV